MDPPNPSQTNNQPSPHPNDDPLPTSPRLEPPQSPPHPLTEHTSKPSPPSSEPIPQPTLNHSDNPTQPSLSPTKRVTVSKTEADVQHKVVPAAGNVQTPGPFNGPNTSLDPFIVNSLWVFLGICGMLAGILIIYHFLLPRIYVCPAGATCRHYLDPNANTIPYLQSIMQYWFQAGLWLSGLGLTKFISYSTRFVLERQKECRAGTLETSLLAVQGSWIDALLQLTVVQQVMALFRRPFRSESEQSSVQRGTSWLGILALLQFGIGFIISIVISSSIDLGSTINVYVPFKYHDAFSLPHTDKRFSTSDELSALYQLNNWLSFAGGSPHPNTVFDGTLVLRDNRTTQTINPFPIGSRITGDIEACGPQGWDVSPLSTTDPYFSDGHAGNLTGVKAYNFTSNASTYEFVAYSSTYLASNFLTLPELHGPVITRQYIWASNTSTTIPNATASHDGGIYYTVCNHTSYIADLVHSANSSDAQIIQPSQPIIYSNTDDPNVYPCPSDDPFICVSWSMSRLLAKWWKLNVPQSADLIPTSCLDGLLVPFNGVSDIRDCVVTGERWAKTLSLALDSFLSIAATSGNATEHLWASTVGINSHRWWIQTVLPGLVLILYLLCGAYSWHLSNGRKDELKEFDYVELLCNKVLVPQPDKLQIEA